MRKLISCLMVFTAIAVLIGTATESSAGWIFKRGSSRCECEPQKCHVSNLPPGARQKCKHGKLWPPQPRPTVQKQSYWQQYHSVNYWPHPYNHQDTALIADAFDIQRRNGWMMMTTLYDYHFNQETNALNSAGLHQLEWILHNASGQYRSAYVQTASDPVISDARLNSVQAEVINRTGHADSLPVMLRVAKSLGRPAVEVQIYNEKLRANTLNPTILYTPGAGGGGSGE